MLKNARAGQDRERESERASERERERETDRGDCVSISHVFERAYMCMCVCVCVCVFQAAVACDESFWGVVKHVKIWARMSPEDKVYIIIIIIIIMKVCHRV